MVQVFLEIACVILCLILMYFNLHLYSQPRGWPTQCQDQAGGDEFTIISLLMLYLWVGVNAVAEYFNNENSDELEKLCDTSKEWAIELWLNDAGKIARYQRGKTGLVFTIAVQVLYLGEGPYATGNTIYEKKIEIVSFVFAALELFYGFHLEMTTITATLTEDEAEEYKKNKINQKMVAAGADFVGGIFGKKAGEFAGECGDILADVNHKKANEDHFPK